MNDLETIDEAAVRIVTGLCAERLIGKLYRKWCPTSKAEKRELQKAIERARDELAKHEAEQKRLFAERTRDMIAIRRNERITPWWHMLPDDEPETMREKWERIFG